MPEEWKPSVLTGSILGLILFYTSLVMSSMLLLCFSDLLFAHAMVLQIPSVLVPIFALPCMFRSDMAAAVAGGMVLLIALWETGYAIWLISASSIARVSMEETEELVGFSLLIGFLAFRLLFLYLICVRLWNLHDYPLHERLAVRPELLKVEQQFFKKWRVPLLYMVPGHETSSTYYSAYLFWLVGVSVVLELEMFFIAIADLDFLNWHLVLVFLVGIPCLAALATFKNEEAILGISYIVMASVIFLLGSFLWIIIASVKHGRIGEWGVVVLLILIAFHLVFSGFLAYSMQQLRKMDFYLRAQWWLRPRG